MIGGFFGSFVAALLSIPVAGALQVIAQELWQAAARAGSPDSEPSAEPGPAGPGRASTGDRPGFVTASRNRPEWS